MGKVWEENWQGVDGYLRYYDAEDDRWYVLHDDRPCENEDRLRLAAAAPEMARALLAIEWRALEGYDGEVYCAGACGNTRDGRGHAAGCPIDAALTAAGLPTQAERDEARKASGR